MYRWAALGLVAKVFAAASSLTLVYGTLAQPDNAMNVQSRSRNFESIFKGGLHK
jgi:hypothetical protein